MESVDQQRMEKGECYTYTADTYPRYSYFLQRLRSIIPRWQKILEAGGLADCLSQGQERMKNILTTFHDIGERVYINLFADESTLKSETVQLGLYRKWHVVKVPITWDDYTEQGVQTAGLEQQNVTVIVASYDDKKLIQEIQRLPKRQQNSIIIFNPRTKGSLLFRQLQEHEFSLEKLHSEADSKMQERNELLGKQIQFLFEERIIVIFDMIAEYILGLVPKMEQELEQSVVDMVHVNLIQSLRSEYVVKDLSPYQPCMENPLTDTDIHNVSEVVGRSVKSLGQLLGLGPKMIETIRKKTSTRKEQICDLLREWREIKGKDASLEELKRVLDAAPPEMKIDKLSLKAILESAAQGLTSEGKETSSKEIDKIFHEKLTDFVYKKSKCIICDNLSKKYGIPAWLLNEFMKSGYFDYEKKMKETLQATDLPKWPKNKSDSGLSVCKRFSFRGAMSLTKLIHETEDYVQEKLKVLTLMKKLNFELCGYILQTEVELDTVVPEIPKLPLELQHALLDIPEVLGCGTCYGELLLHVKETLYPAQKNQVKELLVSYSYLGGFKTQLMLERKQQALGLLLEPGHELRARKLNPAGESTHKYGSIGCFVHMTPRQDTRNEDQGRAGAMVSTGYVVQQEGDHCLTCAHCLKDCHDNIEVKQGDTYATVGEKKCLLYEPDAVDIASVEVLDGRLNNCDSKLRKSNRHPVDTWRVFEFNTLRRDVHKQGCRTDFTQGIVMSDDYMTRNIKEYNCTLFQKAKETKPDLDLKAFLSGQWNRMSVAYNILIESLPGSEEIPENFVTENREPFHVHPFSEEGDSGSVICADDADDPDTVNVVALLVGAVSRQSPQGHLGFLHSYATLMRRNIELLQENFNCNIEPSRLPPVGTRAVPPEGAHRGFASLP